MKCCFRNLENDREDKRTYIDYRWFQKCKKKVNFKKVYRKIFRKIAIKGTRRVRNQYFTCFNGN